MPPVARRDLIHVLHVTKKKQKVRSKGLALPWSDATGGVLGGSRWRLVWLRRRSQLLTMLLLLIMVVAAPVAEISVVVAEKRSLLLEVQLVLSVRRKRGVTCGRDGGNPSVAAGFSLLTVAGAGAGDW